MKKKIASFMATVMMVLASGSLAYAAEEQNATQAVEQAQIYSWVQEGEIWKVKDSLGNVVTNTWYKDADGSFYYLMEDGVPLTGLLLKDGNTYYLADDGKMVVTDGVYNGVSLTFEKDPNSPHYGNLQSGASELIANNVRVTNLYVNNITTQQQGQVQNTENEINSKLQLLEESGKKEQTADSESMNRAFTQEELARMKEALDQIR